MRECVSILICNYSSLNMAIDMGFAGRNQIASDANSPFKTRTGQVNQLKELVGGRVCTDQPANVAIRIHLINMLVHLLLQDSVLKEDLEDLLDDFMEEHFNTIADESSHKEMADTMVTCREQLIYCAQNEFELHSGSQELNEIREFNAKNMANVEGMSKYMLQKRAEMDEIGSDGSGFETVEDYGSVIDEGSDEDMDDDEEKPKGKGNSKPVDDDGFEEVVDKKKRR